jgi:hypothetical protein
MSRQLKVDGELQYLKSAIVRAVPVAEGVKTVTDHANGCFTMIIRGEMVPDEWLTTAFSLNARRHDFGSGHDAHMAFIFPVTAARIINQKFPILNEYLRLKSSPLSYNSAEARRFVRPAAGNLATA